MLRQQIRSEDDAISNAKAKRQTKKEIEDIRATKALEPVKQILSEWANLKFAQASQSSRDQPKR